MFTETMPSAQRTNKILFLAYLVLTLVVLIAALAIPQVRALAYAPFRDLVLPSPDPIVISVLYSTEKAEWMAQAVERFQASNPRFDGHPIELELKKMGSREMYLAVLEGTEQPDP